MTINDFRGQVKVADVQAAFDEIVGRINAIIDNYNGAQELENIDYTKGSPKLAAAGYTLTVGGLKSILNAYSDCIIGAKAYKVSDGEVLLSDGIYIHYGRPYRINSQIVQGGSEPSVRPESSLSFYSYTSRLDVGLYTNYFTKVNDQSQTVVSGSTFNHLNSIPFEFNKVYAIEVPTYNQYDPTRSLGGFFKFAYYNQSLDKVVPVASFSDNSLTVTGLTLDSIGEVTSSTYDVTQSISSISQPSNLTDNTLYVQKVMTGSGIKLNVFGCRYYISGQQYYSASITDSSGSTSFTRLMEKCNYIIQMGQVSNSFYAGTYYEIDGTLDEITDTTQLGTAQHYSNDRPAGTWGDASELYIDLNDSQIYPKSIINGDGTITEIQTAYGDFVTSTEATSNTEYPIIITSTSNSANAYKMTTDEGWSCDVKSAGKSNVTNSSLLKFKIRSMHIPVSVVGNTGTINVYVDDEIVYSQEITENYSDDIDISLDDIEALKFKIEFDRPHKASDDATFTIHNFTITTAFQSYAFVTGETVDINYYLMRLCGLNWNSDDIVLSSIEGVQLEGIDGIYFTTQNRQIRPKGFGSWESIGNTSSGKFVAYTTGFHQHNNFSYTDFLGKRVNGGGSSSDNPYREHFRAQALSLIYIPKGFTISDSGSGKIGRWVYKCKLNK